MFFHPFLVCSVGNFDAAVVGDVFIACFLRKQHQKLIGIITRYFFHNLYYTLLSSIMLYLTVFVGICVASVLVNEAL